MFDRSAAVKLQLRDAKGRFIKMGSHVKWESLSSGSDVSGIVRGEDGNNVIIEFQHGGKPYTIHVPHTKLNVINEKAQLDAAYVQKMGGHTNTPNIHDPGVTPGHATSAPSSSSAPAGPIKNFATFSTNETYYRIGSADGEKIHTPVADLKVGDEVMPIATASVFQKSPYNSKTNGTSATIQKFGPGMGKVVKIKEGAYATIEDANGKQWHVSASHFVLKRDHNTERAVLDAQKLEASTIHAGKTPPSLPWIDAMKGVNAPSAPEAAPSVPDEPNMPLSDHVSASDMPVGSKIPLGGQQGTATKTAENKWVNDKSHMGFDDKSADHIIKTPAPEVLPKDPNTYISAQKPENPLGDNFAALPPMSTYQKGDVAVLKDGSIGSFVGKGQLELEDGSKVSGNKFSVDGVAKVIPGKDIADVYRPKTNVVTGPANGPFGPDAHSYSFDLSKPNNENFKAGDLVVYGKEKNQGKILSVNPTNILVEKMNSDKTVHGTATIVAGQVHGKYVKDKSSALPEAPAAPEAPASKPQGKAPAFKNTPAAEPAPAADPNAPIDISKWTKQGGSQMGSNPGGIYTDENGKQWYVKISQSDDHARTEVLADQLYADSGVAAAGLRLADVGNGKLGTASPMIDGAKADLGHHLGDKAYMDKIQEGFAVDAWLANWDVAGAVYDNIITDGHGNPVRVDPGGALHYRAQGSSKGEAFGNKADEWDTLRNKPGSTSSALFSSMTDQQLVDSAAKVAAFDDKKIDDKVDSLGFDKTTADMLKERLKARRDDIAKRADALKAEAAKEPEKAPEAPKTPEESAPAAPAGDAPADEEHPTYDALDLFGMPNGAHFTSDVDGVKGGYYKKGELWYVSFDPKDTSNGIKVPAHAVVTTLANNPSFKLDPASVKKTSAPSPVSTHAPSGESGSGPGTPFYDKLNSTDKAALAEPPAYSYAHAYDPSAPAGYGGNANDPHSAFPGYNEAESSNVDDFVVDSSGINAALRSGDTDHYNFEIAAMDQILDKSPLTGDTVVYRGLNARDTIVDNIVAGSYSDAGYSSTSTDPKVGHNWVGFTPTNKTPVFMEIHLPAGFKAHKIDYNAISNGHGYEEESEVVLPHGTVYTVSHKEEYTNSDGKKGWKVVMTPILDEHNFDTGDKHDTGANAEGAGHAGGPSEEVHGNGGPDSGVQPGGNEDHAGPVSSPAGAPQEEPAQEPVAPAGPPSYADLHAMPDGTVYSSDGSEGPSKGSIYKKNGDWYITLQPGSTSGGSKMNANAIQSILKDHPEFKNAADKKAPEAPKDVAPAAPSESAPSAAPEKVYPDKGKTTADANGDTVKVNDKIHHPKKGVGTVGIVLPSTKSVHVFYPDGSDNVHKGSAVTKVVGDAPKIDSLPADLKVGDSGIDPATHTKYIVGKNNSLIHIGDTVTHQNGDKGTALAIYAGEKNKTVSVKWENGTTSTKKSSVLESESKHGANEPAAPAEAPAAPTPAETAPEAPAESAPEAPATSGETWGPTSKDASELPVGSTLTNPDSGWNLKKIGDNQWQESSGAGNIYDDSKVQNTFKYEASKVLTLPEDNHNAPAEEPKAPEAPAVEEPQAPEAAPETSSENIEGKKLSEITTPLDQLPVGTTITSDHHAHAFRKLENGDWQAYKQTTGNDMFSKFSSQQLNENLTGSKGEHTVHAPVAEEPSNKPEWDGKLLKDFGQHNVASLPVGTELQKTDSNALMRKVGDDKWLVFNKTTGDLMENMPEINNEDFKKMSDSIATKYVLVSGDGSAVHDPSAPAPDVAAPSGEPNFAEMTPDDLAKGSMEDFAKLPVGTELHKGPTSSYYQKKLGDNEWQMLKSSDNKPAFGHKNTDEHIHSTVQALGLYKSIKLPEDAPATQDHTSLPETLHAPTEGDLAKLPEGTVLIDHQNEGFTYTKQGDKWASVGPDSSTPNMLPASSIADGSSYDVTAPASTSAPTKKDLPQASAADLHALPQGSKLTLDSMPDTTWVKNEDGNWSVHDSFNGHAGVVSSEILSDGDSYHAEIPGHAGDAPAAPDASAPAADSTGFAEIPEATLDGFPAGTKVESQKSFMGSNAQLYWIKQSNGKWKEFDEQDGHEATGSEYNSSQMQSGLMLKVDPASAPNTSDTSANPMAELDGKPLKDAIDKGKFGDLPHGTMIAVEGGVHGYKKIADNEWQNTNLQTGQPVTGNTYSDAVFTGMSDFGMAGYALTLPSADSNASQTLTGVSGGHKITADFLNAQPVGTSMKKESTFGPSQFYYVKQQDGSWLLHKNGIVKQSYQSDDIASNMTATVAVPTPGSKFFYSKSGELVYEGDKVDYKGQSATIKSITDTGLISVKIDGENKSSYKAASQIFKDASYGTKDTSTAPSIAPSGGHAAATDFAGASAEAYNQQGIVMPSATSDHLASPFKLEHSGEPDKSSPLYGTPKPVAPTEPSQYPAFQPEAIDPLPKWDSAKWLEAVKARYEANPNKAKATLEESGNWGKIQTVLNGDEIHLDALVNSKYLDEDLKKQAIDGIVEQEMKNKPLIAEHNAKVLEAKKAYEDALAAHTASFDKAKADYNAALDAWSKVNPNANVVAFTPLPATSTENFTGGAADWSKGHAGTITAKTAFDAVKSDNVLAKKGMSVAVDSDQIEALDTKITKVLDTSGKPVIEAKFKMTAAYGAAFEKTLKDQGVSSKSGIYANYLALDPATGLNKDMGKPDDGGTHGSWTHSGLRYTYTDKDTGAEVIFQRSSDQGINVSSMNNSVRIHMPENSTPEDYQKVLENMGINAKPSTEGDIRVLAENQLLSMMGKSTADVKIYDGAKNHGGAERTKQLQEIESEYGITPADMMFATEPNGRVRFYLSDEKAQQLADRYNVKSFVHEIHDSYGLDTWMSMLTGSNPGLLSTNHRWSEGIGGGGKSSKEDHLGGSSDYIYMTPQSNLPTGGAKVAINPNAVFRRTDFWANPSDGYGKKGSGYGVSNKSPYHLFDQNGKSLAYDTGGVYEVLPKDTVPISDWMYLSMESTMRDKVLAELKSRGVMQINGIDIESFIITYGMQPPATADKLTSVQNAAATMKNS